MLTFVVVAVIAIWRVLVFVDAHVADIPLGRRLGTGAATVLAAIAVISPPAFAAGTSRYLDEEARQMTQWFTNSLSEILKAPPVPEEPPSPTVTDPRRTR